jgi:CheY-like chemotaxis protein
MTISEKVGSYLPYLRRFARAISGSQAAGDAYVLATLEALAQQPISAEEERQIRLTLFKNFLKIWLSMAVNRQFTDRSLSSLVDAADHHLDSLTPLSRIAFLLRSVEGFSLAHIAIMLSMSETEVTGLIEQAGREIATQLSTNVLIIEDEPVIAMDLEHLVADLGHRVSRIARTRKEALDHMRDDPPGLILADIQLADGSSGLDAVNDILAEIPASVIFITAYPERLLTGDRPEPTFLITKPFRPEIVMAVISQALFFNRRASRADPLLA